MYVGQLATSQPHRFVTSGFLHGGLLHIICNVQSWYKGIPPWLESVGGRTRYISIYLLSVIGGNISHTIFTPNRAGWTTPTVGASGGICGLLGYTYIVLKDMNTMPSRQHSKNVMRYMLQLIIIGALQPRVSNAAHIGGFACGAVGGYLLGPRFRSSYLAKRWGNDDFLKVKQDKGVTPELRRIMGPTLVLQPKSRVPLYAIGIGLAIFLLLDPNPAFQQLPWSIYTGLRHPGRLSGFNFR
jgi:membrane associated rhomboid family serine protease